MRSKRIICLAILFTVSLVASSVATYALNPQDFFEQGLHSYNRSDFAGALTKWRDGLELAKRMDDKRAIGIFLTSMGNAYRNLGDYPGALGCYVQSLEIRRETDDLTGEGIDLINIGLVYSDLGNYSKALSSFEQSLTIRREAGDLKGQVDALTNIGNIYLELGDCPEALNHLEQALDTAMKIGDLRRQGMILSNIGVVHRDLEDDSTALSYYKQALDVFVELRLTQETGQTMANIADIYLKQKRFDKALAILSRLNWPSRLGKYYLRTGDYRRAKEEFIRDIQANERPKNARLLVADYIGLGLALEGLGDYAGASAHYRKAAEFIEKQRDSVADPRRKNFFAGKVMGFSRLEPYEGLARISLKLGDAKECFFYSEHTKSRVFLDAVSRRYGTGTPKIPPELSQREAEFTGSVASLYRQQEAAFNEGNPERFRRIEEKIRQLKKEQNRFISYLRASYPEYASIRYPQPIDLDEVALHDDELLLEYEVTSKETIALLLRRGTLLRAMSIPVTRDSLAELVKRYRSFTRAASISELYAYDPSLGAMLYSLLMERFVPLLNKGKKLIIIPDEILCILPFEMLTSGLPDKLEIVQGPIGPYPNGIRYLGDDYQISYYQSATSLTTVRSIRKPKTERSLLAVADPIFDSTDIRRTGEIRVSQTGEYRLGMKRGVKQEWSTSNDSAQVVFPRLERTGEIAERLRQIFGKGAKVLTGLAASESRLKRERLDQYSYLLFATHGILDNTIAYIREPALVLTQVESDELASPVTEILSTIWQFIKGILTWLGLLSGEARAEELSQEDTTPGFLTLSEVMNMKVEAEIVALTACNTGLGKNLTGEGVMGLGRAFQYAGARAVLMSLWSVEDESTNLLTERFFTYLKEGKDKLEALWLARSDLRQAGYEHPYYWGAIHLGGREIGARVQPEVMKVRNTD